MAPSPRRWSGKHPSRTVRSDKAASPDASWGLGTAWVRALLLVLALMMALPGAPARAEPQGKAIEAVIGAQLDAFRGERVDEAFDFASPMIQGLFRTPDTFGEMVRNGYPMVWRPGSVRYLDLRDEGGRLMQRVEITDQRGATHLLEYEMIDQEGAWKINGVRLLESGGLAA
ncbi:DUF4864 domain-containing protein [Marinibacterium sp. SX1]|uniref:DUF4864 domain-containing protein n=1 Tax=Marinibacterium sp. SX1 TaxID=3388424 RepID=UPI003D16610C